MIHDKKADGKNSTPNADTIASPVYRTDAANAKRFVDEFSPKIRFVPAWKKWLAWDGKRWQIDSAQVIVRRQALHWAKRLWLEYGSARSLLNQRDASVIEAFVKYANSSTGIAAMLTLAQSDERVLISHSDIDKEPLLFNLRNGTLDLKTGKLRRHDPNDLLTQVSPTEFDENATCPRWLSTLQLVFSDDKELIEYFQSMVGYCLSGLTGEHFLSVWWGGGRNGKTTLWQTIYGVLGEDYALKAADGLLLGDRDGHPTDVADLFRKRFVVISEPEQGANLRESKVKQLTGDSLIKARRMKEDFWTFTRTHKTFVATNHKPKISGQDEGIWRRVKLIPFLANLEKVTDEVKDFDVVLIRDEAAGIFNWLLAGWQRYQKFGLIDPSSVKAATLEYRSESDPMAEWITDYCTLGNDEIMIATEGYQSFNGWQTSNGVPEKYRWTQTYFGRQMGERFRKETPSSGHYRKKPIYFGVSLKSVGQNGGLPIVAHSSDIKSLCDVDIESNGITIGNCRHSPNSSHSGGEYDLTF